MIVDLLNKRCSIRKFKDKPIPDEVVNYIIEAGRLSPSGGNEQPWKFGIITDKELIIRISAEAYNQKWISTSPLLIVLCSEIVEDERGARDIQMRRFPEWAEAINEMDKDLYSKINLEEHQTKIPGTHMILSALEHGVMSTWISYFKVKEISSLLNLPHWCIPSEIIAFGYPDEEFKIRKKKSREQVVFVNRFEG